MNEYLKSTYYLDFDNIIVKEKVSEIIKNTQTDVEKAVNLFYFVRDKIWYNPYSPWNKPEYYKSSYILKRGNGYCIQKAILLCSMLRCAGIPSKLVFCDIKNYNAPEKLRKFFGNTFHFHGYCGIYLNKKWLYTAPTFNIEMCKRFGYKPTEFNGKNSALLEKYDVSGNLTFEYKKFRGEFYDFPYGYIIMGFKTELGDEVLKKWIEFVK